MSWALNAIIWRNYECKLINVIHVLTTRPWYALQLEQGKPLARQSFPMSGSLAINVKRSKVGNYRDWWQRILTFRPEALCQEVKLAPSGKGHLLETLEIFAISHGSYFCVFSTLLSSCGSKHAIGDCIFLFKSFNYYQSSNPLIN